MTLDHDDCWEVVTQLERADLDDALMFVASIGVAEHAGLSLSAAVVEADLSGEAHVLRIATALLDAFTATGLPVPWSVRLDEGELRWTSTSSLATAFVVGALDRRMAVENLLTESHPGRKEHA